MSAQYPSLAELLTAYNVGGPADAVKAATQGALTGAEQASQMDARRQAAAAKLQELGIQQQGADTQQQMAGIQQQQVNQEMVDPSTASAVLNGQTPTAPVTQQTLSNSLTNRTHAQDVALQTSAQKQEADLKRAELEQTAKLAAQTHADAIASTAQTAAANQYQGAAKNAEAAHSYLPWMTAKEKIAKQALDIAASRLGAPQSALSATPAPAIRSFNTPAEAAAANPPVGSVVIIGGVKHVVGRK